MALNRTDTRQRAYNRIDSSQPQGNWIDEAAYNKHGPGKVLMGNWVEERELKGSVERHGGDVRVHRVLEQPRFGPARAKGGFQSSQFLTNSHSDPPHWATGGGEPQFLTTQQSEFNAHNSDVAFGKPPAPGVRKQIRVGDIIAEAVRGQSYEGQRFTTPSSTYRSQTQNVPPPAVRGPRDSFDYAEDVPVSLYTGNPATGVKMGVQGKTAGTGRNPFAKCASFSTPIDQHPTGGKHQTPEY
eukprot:TRINITY_DN22349_c0_g1_i1.p1 TRINITY_DN22349_c0_g1~~TRINITY_DN22349_c0_g1_i1.p1  ORF type:complete len:241 (+),score=62.01 TRINITY_DN22349_c0_g1_i1:76-798(+)